MIRVLPVLDNLARAMASGEMSMLALLMSRSSCTLCSMLMRRTRKVAGREGNRVCQ